ncbi:MAG: hypothetical protein VX526_00190 [Actinomycetota bacterium]|nr:hypothetical protein [Actinomycetota bacterium]
MLSIRTSNCRSPSGAGDAEMTVMVHSKGSSGEAVDELPEPVNDVVGAATDAPDNHRVTV